MTEPFATATEVQNRLDTTLDATELAAVGYALEDLSNEARFIAGRGWPLAANAPVIVKTLVIRAVQRWVQNMAGLTRSTAGDEQVAFPNQGKNAGAASFTEDERLAIKAAGTGRLGYFFGSVFADAWESNQINGPITGYAHPSDGSRPFRF